MTERLRRSLTIWPQLPGPRPDLRWRDRSQPQPNELDRILTR